MRIPLILAVLATPTQAQFLGTDRADVEAALRMLTEKQLADLSRQKKRPEPDPPAEPSWDEEVHQLAQVEVPLPLPIVPPSPAPAAPPKPTTPIPQWLEAGMPSFGKPKATPSPSDLVVVPAGSFIVAEMLTGADAPIRASIPALIRTRYGFVGPNEGFIDLSGCYVLAKATGDLSSERVKLKTLRLSCLGFQRQPFESAMEAFGAGDRGGFGIPGDVHSRQGRVAMLSFLGAITEGATKILAQSPLTPHAVGSQAGTSASAEVVRWYLEHAKSILPTVEVVAGTPVRLVLLKALTLPKSFFKRPTNERKRG